MLDILTTSPLSPSTNIASSSAEVSRTPTKEAPSNRISLRLHLFSWQLDEADMDAHSPCCPGGGTKSGRSEFSMISDCLPMMDLIAKFSITREGFARSSQDTDPLTKPLHSTRWVSIIRYSESSVHTTSSIS